MDPALGLDRLSLHEQTATNADAGGGDNSDFEEMEMEDDEDDWEAADPVTGFPSGSAIWKVSPTSAGVSKA